MDFFTFRIDEERLAKIEAGRRKDDSINEKSLNGKEKPSKIKSVKSYNPDPISFEEWRRNTTEQLQASWKKQQAESHKKKVKSILGISQPHFISESIIIPTGTDTTEPQKKGLTEEDKILLKEMSIKIKQESVIQMEQIPYTLKKQVA